MAVPPYVDGQGGTGRGRLRVDAARLWTGGLATALVAALVAVVGVLIVRGGAARSAIRLGRQDR